MSAQVEHRLLAVLQDEEVAILSGNYAALEELASVKLALCAEVQQAETDQALLQRIAAGVTRNAALLKAASDGINDARGTIRALLNPGKTTCYGQDGGQVTIGGSQTSLERKA